MRFRAGLLAGALACLLFVLYGCNAIPPGQTTRVASITDGDTLRTTDGTRVRLIGIDTPETKDPRKGVQCFGQEASAAHLALIPPGTEIVLVNDVEPRDRFGRSLAYVYRARDGLFINAELVRQGFAFVSTYPPNVAHVNEFVQLNADARNAGLGLWGACGGPSRRDTNKPLATAPPGACDPNYEGACIPSYPPDLDCGEIAARNFMVVGSDPHRLDANHDKVACVG